LLSAPNGLYAVILPEVKPYQTAHIHSSRFLRSSSTAVLEFPSCDEFIRQQVSLVVTDHHDAVIHKVSASDCAVVTDQSAVQLAIFGLVRGDQKYGTQQVVGKTPKRYDRHAVVRTKVALFDPID